jgi:hypothetical protein
VRKLVVTELVTLDGVVEAPEEWQPPYIEPRLPCALEVQDSSPASPKTWP